MRPLPDGIEVRDLVGHAIAGLFCGKMNEDRIAISAGVVRPETRDAREVVA